MHSNPPKSCLAYVSILLGTHTVDYTILCYSKRWKDWSFVGGHVKEHEREDWRLAAIRETEEEMHPLKYGVDFDISYCRNKLTLPTRISKKTGLLTSYEVAIYNLQFLKDPTEFIRGMNGKELGLFSLESKIPVSSTDCKIAPIVQNISEVIPVFSHYSFVKCRLG